MLAQGTAEARAEHLGVFASQCASGGSWPPPYKLARSLRQRPRTDLVVGKEIAARTGGVSRRRAGASEPV